ncbi:MAG TPA: ATP-binding protein [Stellaceae bacterium]|jgi:signal transduction histidine kinase|nr:ATP-binding protein [Stellaceae bacterium]
MAASDNPNNHVSAPDVKLLSGPRGWLNALGMLRLMLIATIVLPVVLGAIAGYVSYLNSYQRATTAVWEAVSVATENTTKVLDTHLLVAARIDDLLSGLDDDQIRMSEKALHDRIAEQISNLPQVAAAWVIDASGHELVSARVFPVNRDLDHSTREDFTALRKSAAPAFIWMLRARSIESGDYQPFFTVSLRRTAPDGQFDGIVVIAVSGSYFASFYNSLLDGNEHDTANVLRDDGAVLAQYPAPANPQEAPRPDPLLAKAIAEASHTGIQETGSPFDSKGRLVAIKRVGNYPVYVTVERAQSAIFHDWLRSVVGYVVIGVPAAIALVSLSLLALRRTRREQQALARAADASARHAALEVRLHHAQSLEAVGLLTAGIAHDFNNLLTVVGGNVERLEAMIEEGDARRQRPITVAKEACGRAEALTKRLLGLTRQEPADPHSTDINDLVVNTLELPWKSGDRITAEFRLQRDLWAARIDSGQLATALLNLVFNARDAMSRGGRLTITTANMASDASEAAGAPLGDYVMISITDTGHGMTPETREKAFDPLFTTKEPGKGTGLGLALVHAFVTRSGGYCTIDSEVGRGTTVRLYLPRDAEPQVDQVDQCEKAAQSETKLRSAEA